MNTKDRRWQSLKDWYEKLEQANRLNHLKDQLGALDPLAVLSKLTATEMRVITTMVSCSNSMGHAECRAQFRQMREDRFNTPVYERRHSFKVIQGGAA